MTQLTWPDDATLLAALADWLPAQRWYPAKDTAAAGASIVARLELADPQAEALATDALIRVPSSEGSVIVQVPLVLVPQAEEGSGLLDVPGAITTLEDGSVLCDGPHHPAFLRAWTALAVDQGTGSGLAPLDPSRSRVLRGEQSNTSVLIPRRGDAEPGPDGILKVFRVVSPGANPEIEVPVALVRSGWTSVPQPLGWVEGTWQDEGEHQGHLGVVAAFVPGAHDGFELACFYAREGTSFAALAADLGRTVAQMHRALATAFPPQDERDGPTRAAALAASLRARVEWAVGEVKELAELLPAVEEVIDQVESLPDVPLDQRVHGDFHLGQCLHSDDGWFILDFEGEPLRSLEARTRPDQALRDLAGAIRSIDYAAAVGNGTPEWAAESRAALQDAYVAESVTPDEHPVSSAAADGVLERALLLERALYEAVYEARNRPDWLGIPLEAIRREVQP